MQSSSIDAVNFFLFFFWSLIDCVRVCVKKNKQLWVFFCVGSFFLIMTRKKKEDVVVHSTTTPGQLFFF